MQICLFSIIHFLNILLLRYTEICYFCVQILFTLSHWHSVSYLQIASMEIYNNNIKRVVKTC